MTIVLCDSNSVNSYGFRTMVGGINLERFKANPVMLYQHDTERILGHWENIRVEDGKLMADPAFDTEDEEMKPIIGKIERGHLKGCSVGMRVLRFDNAPTGEMLAVESELMEASIVTIPSDANALVLYNPDDERHALSVEEFKKLYIIPNNKTMEQTENTNVITDNSEVIARLQAQNDEKDRLILELQAQLAQVEATQIDAMLNSAVADGRIGSDEVPHWASLAALDFQTVQVLLGKRAPQTKASLSAMIKTEAKPEDKAQEWDKLFKQGSLMELKAKDPEKFNELFTARFSR